MAHHTSDVQQSERKNGSHWNHIDPWIVDLTGELPSGQAVITVYAADNGSDDLTFTWDWGDGTPATARTYFNDGTGPDPYPSPDGTFPLTAMNILTHVYAMTGTHGIRVTVRDDDGGMVEIVVVFIIE